MKNIVTFALVFVTIIANGHLSAQEPFRISPETTYITEPLDKSGTMVDYFAAVEQRAYPPEMQTDENGYRIVFRALGDFNGESKSPELLRQRYEKLGLDPKKDKPTMTYIAPRAYVEKRLKENPESLSDLIAHDWQKVTQDYIRFLEERIAQTQSSEMDIEDELLCLRWNAVIRYRTALLGLRLQRQEQLAQALAALNGNEEKYRETADRFEEQWKEELLSLRQEEIVKIRNLKTWNDIEKDEAIEMFEWDCPLEPLVEIAGWILDRDGYYFQAEEVLDTLLETMRFHEFRVAQDWLAENGPALDLVVEAVKKPVFAVPYIRPEAPPALLGMPFSDVVALREIARGLDTRARIRVATGDIDGAVEDMIACYRLGRHIENGRLIADALLCISIEGIACSTPLRTEKFHFASREQLQRLQQAINELPQCKGFHHKIESERFGVLEVASWIIQNNSFDVLSSRGASSSNYLVKKTLPIDWNDVFIRINTAFDEFLEDEYDFTPSSKNLSIFSGLTMKSRSKKIAETINEVMLPILIPAENAYHRHDCELNMKRIVLAMLLYERQHGTLPPAFTVDENGRPLHGWRTLLLPYFEDETLADLHSQIRLDEPWDSEHNRQFHNADIAVYRCPSAKTETGQANYSVILGEGLPFAEDGQGRTLDGRNPRTLLVVERIKGIPWMQPNLEMTLENTVNRTGQTEVDLPGSKHAGGMEVGLIDGSILFLRDEFDNEKFDNLLRGTNDISR